MPAAAPVGRASVRVRYVETDRMNVAYHGWYFAWFEVGRVELMRELGLPYRELEETAGVFFPVIDARATFRAPARYDDCLTVSTRVASVGGVRLRFEYEISRDGDGAHLASGFTEHAAVGRDGRPRRLPAELRGRLLRGGAALALLATVLAGCAGARKDAARPALTAREGYRRGIELLGRHDLYKATTVLKSIQFTGEDRDELEPLTRLALADATFHQGTELSIIDARGLYAAFVELNGDHALAPYAQLQVGYCSLQQISSPAKDQSQTRLAIQDLTEVRRRWPDSAYAQAAGLLLRQARASLAESEFQVGQFYLKRKIYGAAIARFHELIEGYPEYTDQEKVLYHLGLAQVRLGRRDEGRSSLGRLIERYPDGAYARSARKTLQAIPPAPSSGPAGAATP
jgi:acyl-CoA thioester hydrolase